MPPVRSFRCRLLVLTVALAPILVACGSTPSVEITSSPVIAGGGKQYSYSASRVSKAQWPNPCKLLPRSSAEAALRAAVVVKRFHTRCFYQPDSASFPTLSIKLNAVGTGSASSYSRALRMDRGQDRTSVTSVGSAAYLHKVSHLPATALEISTRYAYVTVTAQSPFGLKLSAVNSRALLVSVGKVVARAFSG